MSEPEAPPPDPAVPLPAAEPPAATLADPAPGPTVVTPPSPPPPATASDPVMNEVRARQKDKWLGMGIVGVTFVIGIGISLWAKHKSRPETSEPPGPPTTAGIRGWPDRVDVTATLAGARAVTRRSILRGISAEGVRADGTLDLTEGPGRVRYAFQSGPGQGPQPKSEIGPLPSRPLCGKQDVRLRKEGLVADPDEPNTPCPPKQPEPLPDPRCNFATIWQRALERGIRSDRLARIEYYRAQGGPAWRFEQAETGQHFVLYGDCRRELKGPATTGRVP